MTARDLVNPSVRLASPDRRYDVDWLRVIAFGVLVFFHTAVLFLPKGIPNILNGQPSLFLAVSVAFLHQFRLGLLFLVSGLGVRFALNNRTGRDYIRDRSVRLLIPLVFGILVVVPPIVFIERTYNGELVGGFLSFYPSFFTEGLYPDGNLSWHHYWFIAYLYLFCLCSWPIFKRWLGSPNQYAVFTTWLSRSFRLYWLTAPLVAIELILRPVFPGFRNLIMDWASFAHWFTLFVLGFILASNLKLLERCRDMRYFSLLVGVSCSSLLFSFYYDYSSYGFRLERTFTISNGFYFAGFSLIRTVAICGWLYTCVGFSAQYLNRSSTLLTYLTGAVYPLFCLHLLAIVAIAYFVLPTGFSIAVKFVLISGGAFFASFLAYEFVIRRSGKLRAVFGARQPKHLTNG